MFITSAHFIILVFIQNFTYTVQLRRVIGGEYAVIAEYPHSGLIVLKCDDIFTCGASILNQKILLSAAHCFHCDYNQRPHKDKMVVFFGDTYIMDMKVQRRIKKLAAHEDWDELTGKNDIALLSLWRNIPFGDKLKRVVLARVFPRITKYSEAFVAGWGKTAVEQDVRDELIEGHLRHTYQKLRSKAACTRYGRMYEGMFCAGKMYGFEDYPSLGDSGSALVMRNKYLQIGVVSFGWVLYPAMSVYTNVSYYHNWIHSNAITLFCENNSE